MSYDPLPENIEATYDDGGDELTRLHQEHHDRVHEQVNKVGPGRFPDAAGQPADQVPTTDGEDGWNYQGAVTSSDIAGKVDSDLPEWGHTDQGATSGATSLDFAGKPYESHTADGDITYSTSNLAEGRTKVVFVEASGADRTLTVPSGWTFAGPNQPDASDQLTVPDGQTAVLSLFSRGTTDADVVAALGMEG